MEQQLRRVVIKIGSNVLTRSNGSIDVTRISSIVDQVVALTAQGIQVVLVSSGAVACGKTMFSPSMKLDLVSARQLYSALGQAKLMNLYLQFFGAYQVSCAQVLTTKESFATRGHYLNQQHCLETMITNGVIPIVNENDTISITELMFTDNDELSGLVATMIKADLLLILSNVDGIYDGNPQDPQSQVIRHVPVEGEDLTQYIQSSKSSFGRGGMLTKIRMARKVSKSGIEVIIANGTRANIITDLLQDAQTAIPCTRFASTKSPISSVKRWIAYSDGCAKGALHLTPGGANALMSSAVVSLLPIGIAAVEGDFQKGDIVRILNPQGELIGLGKVARDSQTLAQELGKKEGKVIVHYDHLYLYDI